jgi:hypothetical protein
MKHQDHAPPARKNAKPPIGANSADRSETCGDQPMLESHKLYVSPLYCACNAE